MNRKENEILGVQTGKIKITQEEIKRREAKEKQRKIENRKRFFIVTTSVVAIALMITGIVLFNSWNIKHKADIAAIAADKALWPKDVVKPTAAEIAEIKDELVVFETSMGTIKLELDPEAAPLTVMNFRRLIKDKFYDGTLFHRVIKDFMVQGGGDNEKGPVDPGYSFKDEISAKALGLTAEEISANVTKGYKYDEGLKSFKMTQGVLAMANSGANTNGAQFFIITAKDGTPWLNGLHTAFGRVVTGLDVALKIQNVKTYINSKDQNDTKNDRPLVNVIVKKAYIEKRVKK